MDSELPSFPFYFFFSFTRTSQTKSNQIHWKVEYLFDLIYCLYRARKPQSAVSLQSPKKYLLQGCCTGYLPFFAEILIWVLVFAFLIVKLIVSMCDISLILDTVNDHICYFEITIPHLLIVHNVNIVSFSLTVFWDILFILLAVASYDFWYDSFDYWLLFAAAIAMNRMRRSFSTIVA